MIGLSRSIGKSVLRVFSAVARGTWAVGGLVPSAVYFVGAQFQTGPVTDLSVIQPTVNILGTKRPVPSM